MKTCEAHRLTGVVHDERLFEYYKHPDEAGPEVTAKTLGEHTHSTGLPLDWWSQWKNEPKLEEPEALLQQCHCGKHHSFELQVYHRRRFTRSGEPIEGHIHATGVPLTYLDEKFPARDGSEAINDISDAIAMELASHPPFYEYDREEILCEACGVRTGYYPDHLHEHLMKVINLMGFAASMGKVIEQATEVTPTADDDGSVSVDGMVFDFGAM